MKAHIEKEIRGSVSVEAGLCVTAAVMFVFTIITIMQYVYAHNVAMNAAISASEQLSKYSTVFCESGLDNVSEGIKTKLINKFGDENSNTTTAVIELAATAFDKITDEAFNGLMFQIVNNEIEKRNTGICGKLFPVELKTLQGSTYFEDGNEFELNVTCESKFGLPTILASKKGYGITVKVKGMGWLNGEVSRYSVSDINVWALDNFKRGKVLAEIYGANLPEMFPVLDIYDETTKTATMIVSIDHTTSNYNKKGALTKTINAYAKELADFSGGSSDGVTVSRDDIKHKKLLIITPKNEMTAEQSEELLSAVMGVESGITVELKAYQYSE